MRDVTVRIDGKQITVSEDTTILNAARSTGIEIPTLCHHQDIHLPEVHPEGACRVCMVEVDGENTTIPSCNSYVQDGMDIVTDNRRIRRARRTIVEAQLANHYTDCSQCLREGQCELQSVAEQVGLPSAAKLGRAKRMKDVDDSNKGILRDPDKCILCGRCVRICSEVQSVGVLQYINGNISNELHPPFSRQVAPPWGMKLADTSCVECGQCSTVCPVAGITENPHESALNRALQDPDKHVVIQTAPAIRVSIGEEFGLSPGEISTGQMVQGLRKLGFDRVFDTNFTADLTIMEEGYEFIDRVNNNGKLPMFTTCSPGWVKFLEHNYPKYLDHLSTCKSPQQMLGALAKSYYASQMNIDPENVYVVSLMPCTAKKYEASRPEMSVNGSDQDVDAVITTREMARILKKRQINLTELPASDYDKPLGISTGAGAIFGATGGVMEAALRTAVEVITGHELEQLNFTQVRGYDGIKEASLQVGDLTVKVAVVHGLSNARKLLELISKGELFYHFIEVMTCPGGCIGGGGQPLPATYEKRTARINAIYQVDENLTLRKSHENPEVQKLYQEYLGEPNGHLSHELLHTEYYAKNQPITNYLQIIELSESFNENSEAGEQNCCSQVQSRDKFDLQQHSSEIAKPINIEPNSTMTNGKNYRKPLFNNLSDQDQNDRYDLMIINGTVSGNYGSYDHRYLVEYSEEILERLQSIMNQYQIPKCFIGIDVAKSDVLSIYTDKLRQDSTIKIGALSSKYPKGEEHRLIHKLTGQYISPHSEPAEHGMLVLNVDELFFVANQQDEQPLPKKRVVTLDGPYVPQPGNYLVELGTPIRNFLSLCRMYDYQTVYVDGEELLDFNNASITHKTGSILVDPEKISMSKSNGNDPQAYTDCVRCGKCVENCPAGLYPSELANSIQQGMDRRVVALGLSECIGCSVCAYLCPSNRPIPDMIRCAQDELMWHLK